MAYRVDEVRPLQEWTYRPSKARRRLQWAFVRGALVGFTVTWLLQAVLR